MKKLLIMLSLIASQASIAQEKEEKLWINPGFVSYHFDREMGFNEKTMV